MLDLRAARARGDVEYLITALSDDDPRIRNAAVRSLGMVGDPRAVGPLARRLDDADQYHRMGVIIALGRLGDCSVTPKLYEIASDPGTLRMVRTNALGALVALGDRRSVPMIAEVLLDPERAYGERLKPSWKKSLRKWAARKLIDINGHEAVPRLEEALSSASLRNRFRLRRVLGKLG